MLEQIDDFLSKPVKHIIELSGRNHWKEISFRKSILELIELLSTKDIHRVAIVDDENKVIALLTQVRINFFFFANLNNQNKTQKVEHNTIYSTTYRMSVFDS